MRFFGQGVRGTTVVVREGIFTSVVVISVSRSRGIGRVPTRLVADTELVAGEDPGRTSN